MNTTAERVNAQHTPGLLAFRPAADGSGSFGILAGKVEDMTGPVVIAETFAEIRRAGEGAVDEARENARRLVACWNACQRFETDLLERVSRPGCYGIHPAPQERIDELMAALLAHLDMQTADDVDEAYRLSEKAIANVKGGAA